jgi:hypothetical protein
MKLSVACWTLEHGMRKKVFSARSEEDIIVTP